MRGGLEEQMNTGVRGDGHTDKQIPAFGHERGGGGTNEHRCEGGRKRGRTNTGFWAGIGV